jgi:hypothetical protein
LKINNGCESNPTARSVMARLDNSIVAGKCKEFVLQIAAKTTAFEAIDTRLKGTLKIQIMTLKRGMLLWLFSLESLVEFWSRLVFPSMLSFTLLAPKATKYDQF